jgi:thioredoxin 1
VFYRKVIHYKKIIMNKEQCCTIAKPNKKKMNSNFDKLIQSEKPILVDFFASWCGPCQMLSPILKEVKEQLGEQISIIKIDVDKNQQVASQYQVRGVPTMILFQNGKQLWRQSGVVDKNAIIKIISEKSKP